MFRMMYKSTGMSPAFMENVHDRDEFLHYRELLAKSMGFTTEMVNDKLFLFSEGKEFGVYYADGK